MPRLTVAHIHFDERIAAMYDQTSGDRFDPEVLDPTVEFLAAQADGGRVVEFAVGTGRVALPLAARGLGVHGIELSPAMVDRLQAKPGAHRVQVTIGDMTSTLVGDGFALVFLVFNTINNLTAQDEQVACFHNAATHLRPGGRFVIEVGVPDLQRLPPGETVRAFEVTPTHLGFDEYDVATQSMWSHHYWFAGRGLEQVSMPFRYVWPAELDLMARLAGMTLRERWADWNRNPFTGASSAHVSVWELPA